MTELKATVLDFFGRVIHAGSTIAYPVRRRSKMWLQKMKVTQVAPGPALSGYNEFGRRVTIRSIENVIVAPENN